MRRSFGLALPTALLTAAGLAALLAAPPLAAEEPRTYRCQGFDEPLNRPTINIGRGRVLPLRAKLALSDGSFADQKSVHVAPIVTLKYQPESGPEVDKTAGIEVRDYGKGNHFVWDDEAHWKFDLGTLSLPDDGKYAVALASGDEKEYRVDPTCSIVFILHGGK